jgi:STE24 endopeptidase
MIKIVVLGIVVVMFLVNLVVSLMNYRHRDQPIPGIVEGVYDQATYNKWLKYSMETLRFELITKSISTVLMVVLLFSGAFGWLERVANSWFGHEIMRTIAFLGIYMLFFNVLVNLPLEYYATFVIEEKYGFNKSTRKTFFLDQLKNLLLIVLLGGGLLAGLQALYQVFMDRIWLFILLAWVGMSFVTVLLFFLNKFFVKIFNKLTPLPDGTLKTSIESLASKVGFKVTAISVMDASRRSTKLNAFFTGLGRTRQVVLYDTLIEKMTEDEIVAVLAHELGHAVHKDVPKMLLRQIFVFATYLVLFGLVVQNSAMAQTFGLSGTHFGFSLLLFSILISPLDLLLDFPSNYLSRKAEYAADSFSAQRSNRSHIMSALVRLAQENLSNLNPHPLYVLFHYNHPPLAARLNATKDLPPE